MKSREVFTLLLCDCAKHPRKYFINRVEDISYIISGYTEALDLEPKKEILEFVGKFNDFVNGHFEVESKSNWWQLMRLYSASNSHSIELFERLFNAFIHDQN